ncbi:hypothetical protein TCE0_022r06437 [Talaromyces pinophilus]|uniref:DUF7779 domain-containing protein n=1 Tax=Talaromyces pinophilus TaxID=128442 RepID=A0A6V8H7R6_TALPI|nr:hypothetical protein TCE0_022r06437 [Talaromyces pinophilus]
MENPAIDHPSDNEQPGRGVDGMGASAAQKKIDSPQTQSNASVEALDSLLNIAEATTACQNSLTECLAIESLREEWAEDRLADFKLWDASVGASSNKKASLEERLILKRHVRNVVLDLLIVLKSTIDQCRELGHKADQHAYTTVVDDEHGADKAYENPASTGSGSNLDSVSEMLLEAVQTADTLLNDLVRLSVVIRKAAINSHNLKADSLFHYEHPDLQALQRHLRYVIMFRPKCLEDERNAFWDGLGTDFLELSISEKSDCLNRLEVDSWKFSLTSNQLTAVQERLISANLRRNHRFRYSQRHALKLGQDKSRPAANTVYKPGLALGHIPDTSQPQGTSTNPSHHLAIDTKAQTEDPIGSILSDTTASAVDSKLMEDAATSVATSQQSGTTTSAVASRIKTQYPRPPRLKERALNLNCPCCCRPLQKKDLKWHQWRKHINGDLHPYTCVLNVCTTPDALYRNKEEWIKHMTDDHSHSAFYWECSLCDDSLQFGSHDAFKTHVIGVHGDAITDVLAFVKVCSKPKILDGMGCPLCSVVDFKEDESGEQLLDHVAEHVHSFALSSLPLLYDDDEDGKKNAYFETNAYFGDSDENLSVASRGTVPEEKDLDELSSTAHAPSVGGGASEECDSQAVLAKSISQIKQSEIFQAGGDRLTISALKKWSFEQLGHERDARIKAWSSTMADVEVAIVSPLPNDAYPTDDQDEGKVVHSPDHDAVAAKEVETVVKPRVSFSTFRNSHSGEQVGHNAGEIDHHYPAERPETPPSPSLSIPFLRDPDFINRGTILDQLHHERCAGPGSRMALVGLGGVGKSQLAIEYAYQIHEREPETWVFWIHAGNAARFEQGYRDLADTVRLVGRRDPNANIFKLVHDWLRNSKNGKWILILDNIDDANFLLEHPVTTQGQAGHESGRVDQSLQHYLPHSPNGSLLITSRSREAALKLVEQQQNIIAVDLMDEGDARALFKKKLGKEDKKENNSQDIVELAAALEFIPLAIVQAAGYISDPDRACSVRQFLDEFQKSDRKKIYLLGYKEGSFRRDWDAENSILMTWQISFDNIRQSHHSAANLLSLMSFFDSQGIPKALLRNYGERDSVETHSNDDNDSELQSSMTDEFNNDILVLRRYSLISVNADRTAFNMHSLVQLATRRWLEANGELEKWKWQYIQNLNVEFPTEEYEYENWEQRRILFPHAKSAARQQPQGRDALIEWASVLYKAAWYSWSRGFSDEGEILSVKAMETWKKYLGPEHEKTLSSVHMVALTYRSQGRWKEAEELFAQVMEMREKVLGAEHPDTLDSMANLALVWKAQGYSAEALDLMKDCVQLQAKVLGLGHPDTVVSSTVLVGWQAENLAIDVPEANGGT